MIVPCVISLPFFTGVGAAGGDVHTGEVEEAGRSNGL